MMEFAATSFSFMEPMMSPVSATCCLELEWPYSYFPPYGEGETRPPLPRRKSESASLEDHPIRFKPYAVRNPRRSTLDERMTDHRGCDSMQRAQTKSHQTYKPYERPRTPAEQEIQCECKDCRRWGLAEGVPRTPTEPRLADGNIKPLCTIPFNVSMSNAKVGQFDRAHEPVFVYLADARMKAGIRIRFSFTEGTTLPDMKAQPFHDGKPITKGHLAMSIATKLENENVLTTNKREGAGELFFVDLVQERWETFRPTFKRLFGGGAQSA